MSAGDQSCTMVCLSSYRFQTLKIDALNILDSHLIHLRPLILSLPDELLHLPRARYFPPVHPHEYFSPLVLHAARVQTLFNPGHYKATTYQFLLASAPKDALLFPKLRSLTRLDSHVASFPALRLLLPTLDTITLDISNPRFHRAIIHDLPNAAPCLKALEFIGDIKTLAYLNFREFESLLLSYPEGLKALSFRCCDIPSHMLNVIARIWSFSCLSYAPSKCSGWILIRVPSHGQPQINAKICSPASTWCDLLSILARTKLEYIIFTESYYDQGVHLCSIPSPFDFHPLLVNAPALTGLKTLVLSPGNSSFIALTDTDILTLACTCPYLDILDLGVRNTPVSLYALVMLLLSSKGNV
ncbi:hypothetical protein DFH29DRAFT_1003909 [Suillus ampliporus]|nr:hypothetical protein DFH29DRAFT_1003909 [Suillus ampliporus]